MVQDFTQDDVAEKIRKGKIPGKIIVMKGVASPDTTMKDIYLGGLPFVYLNLLVMALILFIPPIALWLPSAMR